MKCTVRGISAILVLLMVLLMMVGCLPGIIDFPEMDSSAGQSNTEAASTEESSSVTEEKVNYEITDVVEHIEESAFSDRKTFDVIIEITNTGSVPVYLDGCVLDYEDDDGHLLHTYDFLSTAPDIVQPGEKGYFYTNGSVFFDEGTSFDNGCNLEPTITIKEARGTLVCHNVEDTSLYTSYNSVGCKGRIVNETDKDISMLFVEVVYYDRNDKVMGISGTNVMDITANSKKSFDISGMMLRPFSKDEVASYAVYANEMYMQLDLF